jgi:hypothetical protein
MSKKRVQSTVPQAKRLLDDLHFQSVGDHLSDEDFIDYALETLAHEQVQRVDQHLVACPECSVRMEWLLDASEAWRGAQGRQRLAALLPQALTVSLQPPTWLEQVRAFLDSFSYQIALPLLRTAYARTARAAPMELTTNDRRLSLVVYENKDGDVIVSFDSLVLELEGLTICLYTTGWQRMARLSKVSNEDYVGAEIRIARDERATMPADSVLQMRLVSPTGQSASAGPASSTAPES